MKQSFTLRIAAVACVASLAPGCKKAADVPDAGPDIVVESEVHTDARWVIDSMARLHTAPEGGAPTTASLPIGTKVLLVDQREGGWSRVRTVKGEGWLPTDLLVTERPTVQQLVARHDTVPADNTAERKLWAERAVALEPKDIDALERLLALVSVTEGSFEQVHKGLAALHEVPDTAQTAVILEDGTPLVLTPSDTRSIRTLHAGDVVVTTGQPGEAGWVHVRVVGRLGWVRSERVLALSDEAPAAGEAGPEGGADGTTARQKKLALLTGSGFQERLARNPSVHSRRTSARHLLRFAAREAAGEQAVRAAALWRALQGDPDAGVRRASNEEALAHAALPTAAAFQEQLRQVVGQLQPGADASEREQLAALVRKSGASDAPKLLAALGVGEDADAGVMAGPTGEAPTPGARAESAPPPAVPAAGTPPPQPAPATAGKPTGERAAEKPAGEAPATGERQVAGSEPGHP